jgi:voltage-gated potassium channel Kch
MSSPDIFAAINAFSTLISRNAEFILALPFIRDTVRAENAELIRIAAGAFAGSSSAWIIYLYVREKFYLFPLYFRRHHTIVCGLNYSSLLIIRDLVRRKQHPVVIEKDGHNSYIESCRMTGVIVITGDPTDPHLLKRAGALRANYILSLTDSDETNAEVALQTMHLLPSQTKHMIVAGIQILDPSLYLMIRRHAFMTNFRTGFCIEFFNQYATGSKILIAQYPPLCHDDTRTIPFPVIIIGAGTLGETIVTHIARRWFEKKLSQENRPDIYIIDADAEKIIENLYRQFPRMHKTCNLVPVSLDVRSAAFQTALFLEKPGLKGGFTAYICFHDDTLGLYAALTLHQHALGRKIKILVRIEHNLNVARLVSDTRNTIDDKQEIIPIDMHALTSDSTLIQAGELEFIAQAIHENYCKNEFEKGQTAATNKLLVTWAELGLCTVKKDGIDGKKFQDSNRNQARLIRDKLMMIGYDIGPLTDWDAPETFTFTPDELETLSAVEHERWIQEKLSDGWIWGQVRDDGKKIHPSLRPYDQLSESEKEKDRSSVRNIPHVLSLIDFQIYRTSVSTNSESTGIT